VNRIELKTDLEGLGNESRTNATGTDLHRSNAAVVLDSLDFLQIRIPDGTGFVVRVTDIIAEAGAFTAYFTFS
jgi:hypothetical protein